MLTLILNSMEGPMQLVLAKQANAAGNSLCIADSMCWEPQGQGAETLIPNIEKFLERNGLFPASINRIACVRGPGSFTGIRLALGTALGLSRSIPGRPSLGGIDYLPLIAATAAGENALPPGASIWALTHARRGQVHLQGFKAGERLDPLGEPEGCLLEKAALSINARSLPGAPIYLAGSGLARNREYFSANAPEAILLESPVYPGLNALTEAAAKASYSDKPIDPLYLRVSDAEENLPYIATGLGLDPRQAVLDLLKLTGRSA